MRRRSVRTLASHAFLDGCPRFSIHFPPSDGFTLVMRLLASRQSERDFDPTILEVQPGRHQRQSAFDRLANQLPDLRAMQEELAASLGIVVDVATVAVRTDVDVVEPHLSPLDTREAVAQVGSTLANALHLGTREAQCPLRTFRAGDSRRAPCGCRQ